MTLDWQDLSDHEVTLQVAFAPNGDLYAVLAVVGQSPARYAFLAISGKDFRAVRGFQSIELAQHVAAKHAEQKGRRK